MNMQTASICTSAFGLLVVWSELTFAESTTIEPVEAKLMVNSGNVTSVIQGRATVPPLKSVAGRTQYESAKSGDSAKQAQHLGRGSALRVATRSSESARIRESKQDDVSATDRAGGARSGEKSQSEVAEHRQERRGAASGSGAAVKGNSAGGSAKAG